jgi:hypothetical protein
MRHILGLVQKTNVVITMPHHTCPLGDGGPGHQCDLHVGVIGVQIGGLLRERGYGAVILFGNVERTAKDLNRPESRGTVFRQAVDAELGYARFLLDLHSYPGSDGELGKWAAAAYRMRGDWGLGEKLYNSLLAQGVDAGFVDGNDKNDIVRTALDRGVDAVLLETNETQHFQDGYATKLAKAVMAILP